jgi:hypothetical protein
LKIQFNKLRRIQNLKVNKIFYKKKRKYIYKYINYKICNFYEKKNYFYILRNWFKNFKKLPWFLILIKNNKYWQQKIQLRNYFLNKIFKIILKLINW